MTRTIFIFSLFLFLFSNVAGQNSRSSVLVRKFDLNLLLIEQELVVDSIMNVYRDSSRDAITKIISDTAFIKSFVQPNSNHDYLICSTYKIPYLIKPLGWTSDYGHIFTDEQIIKLDSILDDYEKQTTNEIAVVTFDSSFIHDEDFESLVSSIHNLWVVGKIDKDNGILIGISTAKRKIRISNGDGISAKLSDNETKEIIDNIVVPAFKKGNYFEGLQNAIAEIIEKAK